MQAYLGLSAPARVARFCFTGRLVGGRTWISLGVCTLGLLLPAVAQAAERACARAQRGAVRGGHVPGRRRRAGDRPRRPEGVAAVLAPPGPAHVHGRPRHAHRRASQHPPRQRRAGHDRLRREPRPARAAPAARAALRAAARRSCGSPTTRRGRVRSTSAPAGWCWRAACGFGATTVARRIPPGFSPTGLATIAARTRQGVDVAGTQPLVLATRSVGIFVLVPRGSGAQLLRLAYDVAPPTPTRQPAVTGTRRFGNAVRCERDTWTPKSAEIERQWTVDGAAAGSSTALALTTAAHAGHAIGCTVTATASGMTTRRAHDVRAAGGAEAGRASRSSSSPRGRSCPATSLTCNTGDLDGAVAATFAIRWIRIGAGAARSERARPTRCSVPADNGMRQLAGLRGGGDQRRRRVTAGPVVEHDRARHRRRRWRSCPAASRATRPSRRTRSSSGRSAAAVRTRSSAAATACRSSPASASSRRPTICRAPGRGRRQPHVHGACHERRSTRRRDGHAWTIAPAGADDHADDGAGQSDRLDQRDLRLDHRRRRRDGHRVRARRLPRSSAPARA